MTTPYDAALRLRQREMDDMRISISVQIERLAGIEQRRDQIDVSVQHERVVASAEWGFSAHAFIARMQAQRESLTRDRAVVDEHLTGLRLKATEAYGSLRAIEGAADRHRDEVDRTAAVAEQGRIDDFSAMRYTRAQHDARRSRGPAGRDSK